MDQVQIVYGLGEDEDDHDPGVFDGVDPEINDMFCGAV